MNHNGRIVLYLDIKEDEAKVLAKYLSLLKNRFLRNIAENFLLTNYQKAKTVFANKDISNIEIGNCVLLNKNKELGNYEINIEDKWEDKLNQYDTLKIVFKYSCNRTFVGASEICYFLKEYLSSSNLSVIGKESNKYATYDIVMINGVIQDRIMST